MGNYAGREKLSGRVPWVVEQHPASCPLEAAEEAVSTCVFPAQLRHFKHQLVTTVLSAAAAVPASDGNDCRALCKGQLRLSVHPREA
jgi:hypothetical protein